MFIGDKVVSGAIAIGTEQFVPIWRAVRRGIVRFDSRLKSVTDIGAALVGAVRCRDAIVTALNRAMGRAKSGCGSARVWAKDPARDNWIFLRPR